MTKANFKLRKAKNFTRYIVKILLIIVSLSVLSGAGYYIYLQYLTSNFHTIKAGYVYRSAQPKPSQLAEWHKTYGFNTIINLRGESDNHAFLEEVKITNSLGVILTPIRFSAQSQPSPHALNDLFEALETSKLPILLHCFSGADRTGMASVIAQMSIDGVPYDTAISQMSLKYLHVDERPESIGGLFALYEQWCKDSGLSTAGYKQFKNWATEIYHPYYYKVCISVPSEITLRARAQLVIEVKVENCSTKTIPIADPNRIFTLAVFSGSSINQAPDAEYGPRIQLPKQDLVPGQSVVVKQTLTAPAKNGIYELHHDLIEENKTWFARQGSPVSSFQLTVGK